MSQAQCEMDIMNALREFYRTRTSWNDQQAAEQAAISVGWVPAELTQYIQVNVSKDTMTRLKRQARELIAA